MKKILFLFVGLALLLFGCPPKGDPEPSLPVGTWNITAIEVNQEPLTLNSLDQVIFYDDNTYSMTLPELNFFPTKGVWELAGNGKMISINQREYTFNFTSPEDKIMKLTIPEL